MNFRKKGGHSNPKKIVADFSTSRKKNLTLFSETRAGGQRPFGVFPKKSSKFEHPILPQVFATLIFLTPTLSPHLSHYLSPNSSPYLMM